MDELSIRIIKARKEKRFSQQALADIINISRSAIAQWEVGLSTPNILNLQKMADILGISFEWLATGRGNQYSSEKHDTLNDCEIDQAIHQLWKKMSLNKKRAILNIIKAMEF